MIQALFWFSISIIIYNYFLYPSVIILVAKYRKVDIELPDMDDASLPTISFIVAAYNEEKVIRKKLLNTLSIDYPKNKLEIIVVSDGSDDSNQTL